MPHAVSRTYNPPGDGKAPAATLGDPPGSGATLATATSRLELTVTLPLRLLNPLNVRLHWRVRARHASEQRAVMRMTLAGQSHWPPTLPVEVTVTRIGVNKLMDPHDGLRAACKCVVDGIADALGLDDDSDPRVTWVYAQRLERKHGVEVRVREVG